MTDSEKINALINTVKDLLADMEYSSEFSDGKNEDMQAAYELLGKLES